MIARSMGAAIVRSALVVVALATAACPGGGRVDGVEPTGLPDSVRADYEVFAQRCSKCHGLTRALDSGARDDVFWREYVARMRRQPGSGIAPSDEAPILRFLHYWSLDERRRRGEGG